MTEVEGAISLMLLTSSGTCHSIVLTGRLVVIGTSSSCTVLLFLVVLDIKRLQSPLTYGTYLEVRPVRHASFSKTLQVSTPLSVQKYRS